MNLIVVEMRRALHRRVVRVLIVLALLACTAAGIIVFADSTGKTLGELQYGGEFHPALMRNWWIAGTADGALMISLIFLLLGGLFGGASVAGAEWRAGTVTTALTWEPRRVRFHLSRTAACAILAALISFALQTVFLASLLPAVIANGSSAGTDAGWWASLVVAMLRASLLTAIAAVLGVALATIGRNTSFALIVIFTWLAVVEGLIRGLKPGLAQYLWGENVATALPWAQLPGAPFQRGPLLALLTVTGYVLAITAVATLAFRGRDVASTS